MQHILEIAYSQIVHNNIITMFTRTESTDFLFILGSFCRTESRIIYYFESLLQQCRSLL